MLRICLLACVSLIFGVTAKPWSSDAGLQDTVMSEDRGGIPRGVEVEPPEDMDETDYDIDPKMMIWSKMDGRHEKAEADLDELYHPSMADLLKAQNFVPVVDIQEEPVQEDNIMKYNERPEEDKDDIDHPDFGKMAPSEPEQDWDDVYNRAVEEQGEVPVGYSEPEQDEDGLYHHDNQPAPVQMELLLREVQDKNEVRVHLLPEEDMDYLYHRDPPQPISYQYVAEAAADLPFQRKYSEPEEDLDEIYHH
ncbi:uncharacterized protein si:ch211-217g15.3 [Solea solea]|uniref:uncharacterized protein si:ch211-217g15.3 n=1 Tax=Solea solea TaxID=90069 RepID=UPI00272C6635|nr:uncharacterized protein si:ch211-217g15.3 [Solea solea]